MARRHHYKRRTKKDAYEIDVTTFLNLMVVLVPFLLITAVFSRLTIVELNLPSSAGGAASQDDGFRPEVIVREAGVEITNGKSVIASIPKKDGEYDLQTLSDFMVELKTEYPQQDSASVLMEARIPYDYLIQVMDVVRAVEVEVEPGSDAELQVDANPEALAEREVEYQYFALFSEISVGDAP